MELTSGRLALIYGLLGLPSSFFDRALWHHGFSVDKAPSSAVTVGPQGRLVLEKREAVLQRLLRRFEHVPAEVSLSDDLIAERRSAFYQEEKP